MITGTVLALTVLVIAVIIAIEFDLIVIPPSLAFLSR